MKKLLFSVLFLLFFVVISHAQTTARANRGEGNYTGKRFDSYGKELKKENQRKKKKSKVELGEGDMKSKPYPIGMDKKKKKKRSNAKGKKRKKSCDCPGH